MQSYLYDKSLNMYFSYKGRNSHVPYLSPSNLRICILGKTYQVIDPSKSKNQIEEDTYQSVQEKFSKSDPPHLLKKEREKEKEKNEKEEELDKDSQEEDLKNEVDKMQEKNKDKLSLESKIENPENKKDKIKKKKKSKGKSGFWKSLMPWGRRSYSDTEKMQQIWKKTCIQKNEYIDNHIFTIAWFTYRKGFHKSFYRNITTDSGWGCMIRSGQMLLFTVLNRLDKNTTTFNIISKNNTCF